MRFLGLLLVAFLVNLPVVHDARTGHRITVDGRLVEARVVATHTVRGDRFVDFRLPHGMDPAGTRFTARLTQEAYASAKAVHEVDVRVVPGHPAENRVTGEQGSHLFLVVTALGDLVLLIVLVALLVRAAGRRRPDPS